MKCLILAAGRGSRISENGDPKPLLPLAGLPLIPVPRCRPFEHDQVAVNQQSIARDPARSRTIRGDTEHPFVRENLSAMPNDSAEVRGR